MGFWKRLFGPDPHPPSIWTPLLNAAKQELLTSETPRTHPEIGKALAVLWSGEEEEISQAQAVFAPESLPLFDTFLSWLVMEYLLAEKPVLPSQEERCYGALALALQKMMEAQRLALSGTPDYCVESTNRLICATEMIANLRLAELHATCCELLATVMATATWQTSRECKKALLQLRSNLYTCLQRFPPDAIPEFWRRLQSPEDIADFWPVLEGIWDSRSVPYLCEVLPFLPTQGQNMVIKKLAAFGDIRAIPALQELAHERADMVELLRLTPSNPFQIGRLTEWELLPAYQASKAVEYILANSTEDMAQLLRASDGVGSGEGSRTLLRPATDVSQAPEELLRPSEEPTPEET